MLMLGLLGILVIQETTAILWSVSTDSDYAILHMDETKSLPVSININASSHKNYVFTITSDETIAVTKSNIQQNTVQTWNGSINITGVFLGNTMVALRINDTEPKEIIKVTVIRAERLIDTIFTASIAILVSILYVNYGCAMDWKMCCDTLKTPVGPAIGFFCQFVFMPLLSYFIGYLLFPAHPELQIGMFFTGISPSGGASNIWTVLLGGNLNLSVTMTSICTIASFAMMPFWMFTLGRHIFARNHLTVPYSQIGMFVLGLLIPLAIGYAIQKKLPKLCRLMVKIMKPFSIILIVFIVVFAIITNLYLFKLFSWQIVVAGMGLPWLGFMFGLLIALLFKQPQPDVRAIAIETGIQNTGVAIFLVRFTLTAPSNDLTTVIPVSSAIMTPIPLIILYIVKLTIDRRKTSTLNIGTSGKHDNNTPSSNMAKFSSSEPFIECRSEYRTECARPNLRWT